MARIITNHQAAKLKKGQLRDFAYNGMDCCGTLDIFEQLTPELEEMSARLYRFERSLQNATMTVNLRGMAVDEEAAAEGIAQLQKRMDTYERTFQSLAAWHIGWKPNIQSQPQLLDVFYGPRKARKCPTCNDEGYLVVGKFKNGKDKTKRCPDLKDHQRPGLAERPLINRKTGKPAMGLEQVEKLRDRGAKGDVVNVLARCVLGFRNAKKQIDFLKARRSPDGRLRQTAQVGSTDTLRLSSSKNCYKDGLNFQNVTKRRRNIFVPDPGYIFCYPDYSQGESHIVAYLSGDPAYMAAHDDPNVDTHTAVAKMIWPDADWPGDPEGDRAFAEIKGFYRHFSRRDLSKRIQHGANYGGTKYTVSRTLHIPQKEAQEVLDRYFAAFPGIRDWQTAVRRELRTYSSLISPLGYRRQFFDRPWDDHTAKAAIAHLPQSILAVICHTGFYRIWRELDNGDPMQPGTGDLELLLHGHDAIGFQVKEGREDLISAAADLMLVECDMPAGKMTVGVDIEIGPNWRDVSKWQRP